MEASELWLYAKRMLAEHGERASDVAADLAAKSETAGDGKSAGNWAAIRAYIRYLQSAGVDTEDIS